MGVGGNIKAKKIINITYYNNMNKQEFKKIVKELVAIKKDEGLLCDAFKKFEPDLNYISFGRYETLIVDTLKLAMEDKNDWISYWIYDLECGKKAKNKSVTDKQGKNIPIKTISNLWEIINNKKL
jgi:hypothetical protein